MTVLISLAFAIAIADVPPQQAAGATTDGTLKTDDGARGGQLPVSLDRIQRALSQPPLIQIKTDKPVFRVEVFGKKPTIEDILGPDYLKGPAPYGGMTHQEFLDMVTPKDVRGYAAFTNTEGLVVAATSFAEMWALQKAIHKFETAKEEHEREAARREVQDALAELAKARKAAGLPPK